MERFKLTKRGLFWLIIGILVGFLLLTAVRFMLVNDEHTHYHANFALYINGQHDEFKSFTFYEEVAACDAHEIDNPKTRSHMHGQNNHLVHVHADGITWSDFFNNLGYTLGDSLIKTDQSLYVNDQGNNKLTFTLNGQKTTAIANKVIQSEDVLLINYGQDDDKTLQQRYDDIPRDAHQANVTADPSACQGQEKLTFTARLKEALGL